MIADALFIAPDAAGDLFVWGPHPTRPDLPVVLGGLPREGMFREWLLDNLPTRATDGAQK